MSDSSGESSNDSILNSPVFKRRSNRASKSKLSFLDACLNGTIARTNAQRRLVEVENEHIMEIKEMNNDEEVDKISPKSHAAATDTSNAAENDGKGSTVPLIAKEVESEHQLEEAYWDRVESFKNANKEKMSAGIDADRNKLSDAMNGLDYTSETDDEEGKWNDGMSGMTSDQKKREARAKLQCQSVSLGLRKMFQEKKSRGTCNGYADKEEAMNELKVIVTSLQKRYRNETGEAEATLRRQLLDPLNKIFKKPKDVVWGLLLRFFQRNKIVNGSCTKRGVTLPKLICEWMWNAACTSYEAMGHLSTACCQNLVKMIVNEMDVDDSISFCADLTFVERFSISDFVSHLENDCGLWLSIGPIPPNENMDNSSRSCCPSVDVYTLKNVFLLWKALLDRDLIKLNTNNSDTTSFVASAKAVTALTRAGIDPTLNLANDNTSNCINSLPHILQGITSSLIKSTMRQISKIDNALDARKKWLEYTTSCMVQACSNLAAGGEDGADHDDDDGWLALACAAERMVEFEYDNEDFSLDLDVVEVKLNFSVLALQHCMAKDDLTGREDLVSKAADHLKGMTLNDDSNESTKRILQISMRGLIHADISLRLIDKNADAFMRDHPHLLASVILSGECAFVGLNLSKMIEAYNLQLDVEEKCALVDLMTNIENTCNNIKKKCPSIIAYPHLRRVKEFLTRMGKAIGGMKGKGHKRRKTRTQGSLDSWRRTSLPLSEDTLGKDSVFNFSQDSNCSSQDIFLQSQD